VDATVHRRTSLCAAHVARVLCVAATLTVVPSGSQTKAETKVIAEADFPDLPLPPAIEGLIGFPQVYSEGRNTYLGLITREAEQHGLPAAVADAVAYIDSGYKPFAVGKAGEVGLMQVRFERAVMLGYKDGLTRLFDPETNVRYGVMDLAQAWRLANGDLCRALMKYRAGQDEERMSPRSVEYCGRARGHLAAIGSPLASGALPITAAITPFASEARAANARNLPKAPSQRRVSAVSAPIQSARAQARSPLRSRTEQDSQRFWAAHNARIRAIKAKFQTSRLRIMTMGVDRR
jgi:hypothetical protein